MDARQQGRAMMKFSAVAAVLALALCAGTGMAAERYEVIRHPVTLATGAGDDMRPQIVGQVEGVGANEVELVGGARVPVSGAMVKTGQLATFVCASIGQADDNNSPPMRGCELQKVEAVKKSSRGGAVELW